jgi:hypothetical protein
MASATEAPPTTLAPRHPLSSCGACSYVYNSTDGCYHRQTFRCSSGCTCSPLICGLGSLLIQLLKPETVAQAVPVLLPCSASGSDEEAVARSLVEVVRGLISGEVFWKRVSIGLGILSVLLAIGLVVALVYR